MYSLLRRSFMIVPRRYRLVNYFQTTGQGASFCSSSSGHDGNVLYHPTTRECVHDTLSPKLDCDINIETQQHNMQKEDVHVPNWFPFRIIDNPGEETITLVRKFGGESIEVLVRMPDMTVQDNNVECNDNVKSDMTVQDNNVECNDNVVSDMTVQDNNVKCTDNVIPLNATVFKEDKENGPRMEFYCKLSADDITIDKVLLKGPEYSPHEDSYVGPYFPYLDKKVQKMFVEYLEMRGIQTSMANFLQDYMTKKYIKELAVWTEELKQIFKPDPSLQSNNSIV